MSWLRGKQVAAGTCTAAALHRGALSRQAPMFHTCLGFGFGPMCPHSTLQAPHDQAAPLLSDNMEGGAVDPPRW